MFYKYFDILELQKRNIYIVCFFTTGLRYFLFGSLGRGTFTKKRVVKLKQHVFQEVKKFKIQRCCKSCNARIVVENANRYYCASCRGY